MAYKKKKTNNLNWAITAVAIVVTLLVLFVANKHINNTVDKRCKNTLGKNWYAQVSIQGTNKCINEGGEVESL